MRNTVKILWLAVTAIMLVAACEKEETGEKVSENSIEGVYTGTLTEQDNTITNGIPENITEATAEVTITGENIISVNCYSSKFDTTFRLNYYEHHDSAYVCFTGEDFEMMYGHVLGNGHMMSGIMGDIGDGETEWMHHMEDEHDEADEHFGGFNMDNHTFSYTFRMTGRENHYEMIFQGSKLQ